MTWAEEIIGLLIEERERGVLEFGPAWRRAQARCSRPRPRDFTHPELDDPGWMPYSTFVRRCAEREWAGRVHTDYLHLRELLEDSGLSSSSPARERISGATRVHILA